MAVAPAPYFTEDFTIRLDDLLFRTSEELQISESRYKQAEERYKAVNKYLEAERSPFYAFKPDIYPQGSMKLNTTVKPIEGPHDLDFVLELGVSHEHVDPMKLIESLYIYLKDSEVYGSMTSRKNRCIRIEYANEFYMDVLIACKNFSASGTCIKVPDRKAKDWKDSNPRGYARWFEIRSALYRPEVRRLIEAAEPIPDQLSVAEKTPLQLAVQLLKRWRDIRFNGSDLAPISIVLTTLAGDKYVGQQSVSEAIMAILDGIVADISEADRRFDRVRVHNPSNHAEDLSERWDDNPKAYFGFRDGMIELQKYWRTILTRRGSLATVSEALESLFGEPVKTAITKQAQKLRYDQERNKLGVASSGLIGLASSTVPKTPAHTFYGEED